MKANKQKIIDEILLELEAGKTHKEVLALNGYKWQLSKRTFQRYWNDANELYSAILEKRKVIFEDMSRQNFLESVEGAIMSRTDKLKILEKIIKRDSSKSASDVLKAIEVHNKMTGDNEPFSTRLIQDEKVTANHKPMTEEQINKLREFTESLKEN